MLWTCEIQDAQYMISMGKLRFSSCFGAKAICQGPPGTAKAQLCFKWSQIQHFFCLYKHSPTPSKVLCETHMRKVHFIEKWCLMKMKSISRKMGVGGPMTICMLTKDAEACCVLLLSEWSVSLLFPWFKDNLTKANQYLVFWQDDLLGTAVTQNVNYFDFIKYFKDLSHWNV